MCSLSLIPSPNLRAAHPKLTGQTDPALSLTITSSLRLNESTLYQSSQSLYDPRKKVKVIYGRWLKGQRPLNCLAHCELIFLIHFPKRENK